jgi:hypothetical protein
MVAIAVGLLASALSVAIGTRVLGLEMISMVWAIVASNIAGFVTVLTILTLERQGWVRRHHLLSNSTKAWTLFWFLSLGILCGLTPVLRSWHAWSVVGLPLILSSGLMIPLFGKVQDAIVHGMQRKARAPKPAKKIPMFVRTATDAIREPHQE